MPKSDLQSRLEAWTLRALQASIRRPCTNGAVKAIGVYGNVTVPEPMLTVASALKLAARRLSRHHPLCDLPSAVIRRICLYLDPLDILLLSHASHGVRAALLAVPEIWSRLPIRRSIITDAGFNLHFHDVPLEILDAFSERSVPIPLDTGVVLSNGRFSEKASFVARRINRMGRLVVICRADVQETHGQAVWSLLLQRTLCDPAPQLHTLQISFLSTLEGNPPGRVRLPISSLFSGEAPSLRVLVLEGVHVLPTLHNSVFQNLTVFSYEPWARTSLDDLRIIERMPRLRIFQWGGAADFSGHSDTAGTISLPGSLHTLFFTFFNDPDFGDLRGIVPVDQLRELWIRAPDEDLCIGIAHLYSDFSVLGISIRYSDMGPIALLQIAVQPGGGTAKVVVNIELDYVPLMSFLSPFPSLTWLTIHEHFWGNDFTGPAPVLPAVTILSVCLASSSPEDDSTASFGPTRLTFAPASAGLFSADMTCRWSLPALQEIRLTSPPPRNGVATREKAQMSISLEEVARWIRDGVAIEPHGRLLDRVVLSGVRVIDPDFCAAWDAVMTVARTLQLIEKPDTLYHTSASDMDFGAHLHSFTDDSD